MAAAMLATMATTTTAGPATAPTLITPTTMTGSSTCARGRRARAVRMALFDTDAPPPQHARKSARMISACGAKCLFGSIP
eukprot:6272080-Pyramimonas_sp.AAC.1